MIDVSNQPNVATMFADLGQLVSEHGRELGDGRKVLVVTGVEMPGSGTRYTIGMHKHESGWCDMGGYTGAHEAGIYFSAEGVPFPRDGTPGERSPSTPRQLIMSKHLLDGVKRAMETKNNILDPRPSN